MMTAEENASTLRSVKHILEKARDEISGEADFMETWLTTEYELLGSEEYGRVCRVLGILEEQIAIISNQLTKFTK